MADPTARVKDDLPPLRFIPFRRADVLAMCLAGDGLTSGRAQQFIRASEIIEHHFREDFSRIKQELKDSYATLDPDADTRVINEFCERTSPRT